MKHLTLIMAASMTVALPAIAADDFGSPFTNEAPAGFEDSATADGTIGIENIPPELIEPAAGDYFDSEDQGVENEEAETEKKEEQPENAEIDL